MKGYVFHADGIYEWGSILQTPGAPHCSNFILSTHPPRALVRDPFT